MGNEISRGDVKNNLNISLRRFFTEAVWVSLRNPGQAFSFFRVVRHQMKAAKVRARQEKQGVHVPPIVIYSVTNRCNLHCKGCYHQALHLFPQTELGDADMLRVIGEARELGVSFMVLAGGEPLVRKGLLDAIAGNPQIIFFVFTNGTLIDDEMVARLKKQRNIVPLISMEGLENETDDRRGEGVYSRITEAMSRLHRANVFFGTSLTVTRNNYSLVTDDTFVQRLSKQGCNLFLYAEYTPAKEGTEDWIVTAQQRLAMTDAVNHLRRITRALFVSVPGDEEQFGGCLAAGKGFVHISAEGNVEPCPFSPYSVSNLQKVSLREALQSDFLKQIRENRDGLGEGPEGCALWAKRDWVHSLTLAGQDATPKIQKSTGAPSTGHLITGKNVPSKD